MSDKTYTAWYFAKADNKLAYGDGREIIVGETHEVDCEPKICKQGLHGSIRLIDALNYASSNTLYRVEISGSVDIGDDKIAGKRRKYLKRYDVEDVLGEFTRKQALVNIELIKPYTDKYDLIVEYLQTGKEELKDEAAIHAARAADCPAADYDAGTGAYAARAAARAACGLAAYAACGLAAYAAAGYAAGYAAYNIHKNSANKMLEEMVLALDNQ